MIYLVGLARLLVNRNPIFQLHQRKTCILLPAAIAAAVVDSNALDSMIGSGVSLKNIIDQRVVKLKNSIYAWKMRCNNKNVRLTTDSSQRPRAQYLLGFIQLFFGWSTARSSQFKCWWRLYSSIAETFNWKSIVCCGRFFRLPFLQFCVSVRACEFFPFWFVSIQCSRCIGIPKQTLHYITFHTW